MSTDETLETGSDTRPGAFLGQISTNVRAIAADICRNSGGQRVLDVGCGNGLLFAEAGNVGCAFFGVDTDAQLLNEGRRILKDNDVGPATFTLGDGGNLPFLDNAFDKGLLLNTLINIPTDTIVAQIAAELVRITAPGGKVVVDIRNNANIILRLRYALHNRTADFTTRGYRLNHIRGLFEALRCEIRTTHSIGPWLPFGASGIVVEAQKLAD